MNPVRPRNGGCGLRLQIPARPSCNSRVPGTDNAGPSLIYPNLKIMMKKFALWSLALLLTFAAACSDYDDTELWNSVNDIKKRVEALETAVAKLNSDVSAMQTLIEKLNEKVYVSKVETNADGSYTIYFTDPENTKITITNGKDGAAAPVIGVAEGYGRDLLLDPDIGRGRA